jgi:hypothetical protein
MTAKQRELFDIGMKSLQDQENSLKKLQDQYEKGVVSGLSKNDLADLETKISKKYADTETTYLNVLQLIQSAIAFPTSTRLVE